MQEAQASQTKYTGNKDVVLEVADKVWPTMRHFGTTRPSKILNYKWTGPYTVSKVINKYDYKLDHQNMIQRHNVFHLSSLDRYTTPTACPPLSEPQLTVVDDCDEWEVDRILDSKQCNWKLNRPVQCAGNSYVRNNSKPAENLVNEQELVDNIDQEHPRKPRQWLAWRSGIERWGGFIVLTFFWISAQYKCRRHFFLPPPETSKVDVEFPCALNAPWGCS